MNLDAELDDVRNAEIARARALHPSSQPTTPTSEGVWTFPQPERSLSITGAILLALALDVVLILLAFAAVSVAR